MSSNTGINELKLHLKLLPRKIKKSKQICQGNSSYRIKQKLWASPENEYKSRKWLGSFRCNWSYKLNEVVEYEFSLMEKPYARGKKSLNDENA